ncbi:hypothetical protein KUTeg_024387 [Tegillarca granosa]|uniref:Major facilitator superfamily (MFS) profile domain-containing protein n=1 Tax=Tegillarca granosa TaxID=220873 RepID=A0ABQ9E094_TEGGR|nr:hypothetical protein KUTeg_024387 [Tegillarca granosa]
MAIAGDYDDSDEHSRLLQTHPPHDSYSVNVKDYVHSIQSVNVKVYFSDNESCIIEDPDIYKSRWRSIRVIASESCIIEHPDIYKSRWRSIRVMYLTMFLSSVSFSICMSSVWPYLRLVMASYSLGQLIASPFFGAWANKRGKSREPLVVSLLINIMANVLYVYLESISSYKDTWLVVARAFIGFGAGNVAVVRSYVSGATTLKERTPTMANISAFQAIGFIIGPAIQTAMVPIGYPGPVHSRALNIDLYTSPAILSAVCGVINLVLLFVVFREHRVENDEDMNFSIQGTVSDIPDYKVDIIAVSASILIFFIVLFLFSVFETIGTPLTMHMYDWTKSEATLVNERYLLLTGFIFCFIGFFVYLPWGHTYPTLMDAEPLSTKNIEQSTSSFEPIKTTTDKDNVTTTTTQNTTKPSVTVEPVGCPDNYKWCRYTPVITLAQFLIGTFLICIGYPTCNVMSYAIYSKLLGPKPQGVWMGLLTASGSLARTLGPIFVSQIYNSYGPRVTFIAVSILVLLTIGLLGLVFRKLVPFSFSTQIDEPVSKKYIED